MKRQLHTSHPVAALVKGRLLKSFLYLQVLVVCLAGSAAQQVQAQCGVTAQASSTTISCGTSVTLTAIPNGAKPLNNNFNDGTMGTWGSTSGAVVTDGTGTYSCVGASPDPSYFLFMGSTAATPRFVQSAPLDLTSGGATGATACFYMKYSTQATSGTCEGPDLLTEGVYLEYSTNCSTGWTEIEYWDPNGGFDSQMTSWNQYCVNIPAAALTSATCFRWIQKSSSGIGYDTWAIDKVEIVLNIPGYKFDWQHDAQAGSTSPVTADVTPVTTTTYTVTYSNLSTGGSDTCSSSVVVNVSTPAISVTSIDPICSGENANLEAISLYDFSSSTSCGLSSPAQYCNPLNTVSGEYQVGSGSTVNNFNSITSNTFGDFGYANATTQILFLASELQAAGVKAGKLTSLAFNISRLENSGTGAAVTSASFPNFSISLKCASNTTLSAFQTGFSQVYSPKTVVLSSTGWRVFDFDNYYDWDGTSNIIVQVCWYLLPVNEPRTSQVAVAKTTDNAAGYNCLVQYKTNFSPGSCATTSATVRSQRPNVKFGNCQSRNIAMSYSWSPSTGVTNSTSRIATATAVTATQTYTVTAYPTLYPTCVSTANIVVSVGKPSLAVTPSNPDVCPASGVNSVALSSTGTSAGTFTSGTSEVTFASSGSSVAIPDNDIVTGISNTVYVSGISPSTLAANLPVTVCINLTHTATRDLDISLKAPGGATINLTDDNGSTGDHYTNTCFSTTAATAITAGTAPFTGTYTPEQAFSNLTGNVNGFWTLIVKDDAATNTGSLVSWNITFNTGPSNSVVSYSWSPSTGLSATNIENPVASPAATTTYTVAMTDAAGCTNAQSVVVTYCAPLPVEMLEKLSAVKAGSTVKLRWKTALEVNSDYFAIERAGSDNVFHETGRVAGKGNSAAISSYLYTDEQPLPGVSYYRLRQVDYNGNYEYSDVAVINCSLPGNSIALLEVGPVPAGDVLKYSLVNAAGNGLEIHILDMSGKLLKNAVISVEEGTGQYETNVSDLSPGVYLLRVVSPVTGDFLVHRFVK